MSHRRSSSSEVDASLDRFDRALRTLAEQPAPTPAAFAAARIAARLAPAEVRSRRFDLRPWLAAAAFAGLAFALPRLYRAPTSPATVPAPVAPGVVVFALDSETTLYMALPADSGGAGEDPS